MEQVFGFRSLVFELSTLFFVLRIGSLNSQVYGF